MSRTTITIKGTLRQVKEHNKFINALNQKAAKAEKIGDLASKYAKEIAKEYKKIDCKANRDTTENKLFNNILEALGD